MTDTDTSASAGSSSGGKAANAIDTVVTFPLGHKPFKEDYDGTVTVESVRAAAMTFFEVAEDPALRFYLVHDGAEVANTLTLGELAGRAKALKFTLAKEIVNG